MSLLWYLWEAVTASCSEVSIYWASVCSPLLTPGDNSYYHSLSSLVLKGDIKCCESRSLSLARCSVLVGQRSYPRTDRRSLDLWLVVFLAGLCRFWSRYQAVCGVKFKPVFCGKGRLFSGVSAVLLRYGCSQSLSPLVVWRLIDNEECSLARSPISSYFRRCLGDFGIQGNEVKPTSPGLMSIEENGYW